MKNPFAEAASGLLAVCMLSSCSRVKERMEITETREISTHAAPAEAGATSEQRFGPALRAMGMDRPEEQQGPQPSLRDLLTWTAPPGWSEAQPGGDPSGMRLVDMRFGEKQEGECYISIMPGPAGGLNANLNRWRKQMGQPDYTDEEIAKLPKKPLFKRDGVYAEFDGDYKGVGMTEASKGYRLAGVIHSADQATIFVKMIGPKALVEANTAAFDQFCQSITPKGNE
jgi:hypothetical protein